MQQKQESNLPKEVFKIAVGNEFKSNVKLLELNQIDSIENVCELTTNKNASKW
jgi:hypothetical protein